MGREQLRRVISERVARLAAARRQSERIASKKITREQKRLAKRLQRVKKFRAVRTKRAELKKEMKAWKKHVKTMRKVRRKSAKKAGLFPGT